MVLLAGLCFGVEDKSEKKMSETTVIEKETLTSTGKSHWRFPEIEGCNASLEHENNSTKGSWYIHSKYGNFLGVYLSIEGRFLLSGIGKNQTWERKDVGLDFTDLEQAVRFAYLKWEECGRDPYRKV